MERAPVLVRHGGLELRQLPPGFRFHPTDEELVVQYLRRKALGFPLPAAVIPEVHDLYKLDPWDIPGASEGEKYFFAVRPAAGAGGGTKLRGGDWCRRPTTASGCWKSAGGREKPVVASRCGGNHLVGVKRSMVFALRGRKGRAPRASPVGQADWVMHEYRLTLPPHKNGCLAQVEESEEWVVCRIFQRNRPSRRPDHDERRVPGGHATVAQPTMIPPSLSASSSSSCVTSSSDQEEVSSGRKQDAAEAAASKREA